MILQPIPGAPGVLAVDLSCIDGRLSLTCDPDMPHSTIQVNAGGVTVAVRLDRATTRVLGLACREGSPPVDSAGSHGTVSAP